MSRAFQFQDRRLWRREEEGNAERRRESRRHKDSYRPGNVEEEREEACSLSLFFLYLSFLAPSRALSAEWASLFEIYDDLIAQLI